LLLCGLNFGILGLFGSIGCLGGEGCLDIYRLLSFGNGRQDEPASLMMSLCVHWVFMQECRASTSYIASICGVYMWCPPSWCLWLQEPSMMLNIAMWQLWMHPQYAHSSMLTYNIRSVRCALLISNLGWIDDGKHLLPLMGSVGSVVGKEQPEGWTPTWRSPTTLLHWGLISSYPNNDLKANMTMKRSTQHCQQSKNRWLI
jgi:hypothetical protein